MPILHVIGMGSQVGARFRETNTERKIQMVGLQISDKANLRYSTRELTEGVIDIRCKQHNASQKDARCSRPGLRI